MCAAVVLTGCAAEEDGQAEAVPSASGDTAPSSDAASSSAAESPTDAAPSSGPADSSGRTTLSKLPVPLSVTVPEGWSSVDPAEAGVASAAFVGIHDASRSEDFLTNITVEGSVVDSSTTLTALADQELESLGGTDVELGKREEGGSGSAKSLTQVIRSTRNVDGTKMDLAQIQVFFGFQEAGGSGRTAVDMATFSTTADKMSTIGPDFQEFISSVRPQLG